MKFLPQIPAPRFARALLTAALAGGAILPAQVNPARSQGSDPATEVVENFEALVPHDAKLVAEDGREVTMGSFFGGPRPVILNLGYYGCPALCGAVLNGFLEGLKGLSLEPGKDFEIVTISIDPTEGPALAREKKQAYLKEYDRAGAAQHWHFLTGAEAEVRKIADAIGYGYRKDTSGQYMHGAALAFLSSEGLVMRYLFGVEYPPRQLRFAIVEAGRGSVGTVVDKLLLNCYRYDPKTRGYALAAMTIMQWGGGLTVLVVAGLIGWHLRRERRQRRLEVQAPAGGVPAAHLT